MLTALHMVHFNLSGIGLDIIYTEETVHAPTYTALVGCVSQLVYWGLLTLASLCWWPGTDSTSVQIAAVRWCRGKFDTNFWHPRVSPGCASMLAIGLI